MSEKTDIKERPVLMCGQMVRATLDDLKTHTRREIKPQPETAQMISDSTASLCYPGMLWRQSPYGKPGDRLWVRETFYIDHGDYQGALLGLPALVGKERDSLLEYRADHDCSSWEAGCPCNDENGNSHWKPSIFMPRWASRLTLEIIKVRVERLQEISADDAIAEGITEADYYVPHVTGMLKGRETETPVDGYRRLWESINGPGSWAKNPWVWVIEFRRLD